ncbi:kinase-like protein [Fomes fomentarius]|nr:kinase-like protein [Fomes fomentarius]
MPPTIGPDLAPSPSLGKFRPSAIPLSRSSTSSSRTAPDNASVASVATSPACSSSSLSIPFDDVDVDVVRVDGLRHAAFRLEARRYKTTPFVEQLVTILRTIRVPSWTKTEITPADVTIQKVSGSLTNAVFFVSCTSLHTLHVLSSKYHIGPRVYGTFENGRVEEYFDSTALTAADLRDPETSSWIGARMAELHGVDIDAVEYDAQSADGPERGVRLGVKKNVQLWLPVAREVLALPSAPTEVGENLDLDRFAHEWHLYMQWLYQKEKTEGTGRRVFSHNDAQYGNLLRLRTLKEGQTAHRQIIVVDFEYASPNPAAFDIANHFHEWTVDYHGPTPHILDPARYPTLEERQNFYRAYLTHTGCHIDAPEPSLAPDLSADALAAEMDRLDSQVRVWSPASHGMWAVWGIVQAREFVEGKDGEPEFDYLGYALCRMERFRRELRALAIPGLPVP